jgi:hypothetical protein
VRTTISATTAEAICAEIAAWGARDSETGGFLLAAGDKDTLATLALSGARGVRRAKDQFRVSPTALGKLFNYAADNDLRVAAAFHSHKRSAFLSKTDLEYGLNVKGLISVVIPHFQRPSSAPSDWRWWNFAKGWEEIEPAAVVPGAARILRFDEEGVRES